MIRNWRKKRWAGGKSSTPTPSANFDLTAPGAALPTGFTYTRADTVATYRDSNGIMRVAASNTPRFNFPVTGDGVASGYGLREEPGRTNLCTNFNKSPTDLTGITAGGDVLAVVACVDDTTGLSNSAAKLNLIGNAKVIEIDNTLGVTAATATISGATGSTSKASMSAFIYCVSGGGLIGTDGGASTTSFSANTTYTLTKSENFTPASTSVKMMVTANAGAKVRFILNQMELGAHASSSIIVAGASAARANEVNQDTSITSRSHFNLTRGAIIANFTFDDILTNVADNQLMLSAGTGLTYTLGVGRIAGTTRSKAFWRGYINSTNEMATNAIPNEAGVDAKLQRYPVAISWVNGNTFTAAAGACTFGTCTPSGPWVGIDRLYLGCRSFTEMMSGHILSLTFYKQYLTPAQLGKQMVLTGNKIIHTSGQSNMTDWFYAQSLSNNTGQRTAQANIDAFWTATRNMLANGGTVGTSVKFYSATSDDTSYWLNTDTGAFGAPFRRCLTIMQGDTNATIVGLIDTSGESDAGNCTVAEYVAAEIQKFNIIRSVIGNVPVFMVPIGRNTAALDGYQTIREADWALAGASNPGYIYRCPERFDLALSDSIHMTDAAAGICADRTTRKMLKVLGEAVVGGVDGPAITNVSRSGTAVTVTLTHDGGTDFTPTSAISGFRYYNGPDYLSTANTITAAVRTNATTITLTLTTNSAGTLYYGKGSLSVETVANLVKDNSTQTLPLQSSKWTVV